MLVFPGLLFALPFGWLALWIERKAIARFQRRIGPPFFQPFFDFVKLMGKIWRLYPGLEGALMIVLPLLSVGSMIGALALVPVLDSNGFVGDCILLAALLEVPAICSILAGFSSRSLFGQLGAVREALLAGYNLPFLIGLFASVFCFGRCPVEMASYRHCSCGCCGAALLVCCRRSSGSRHSQCQCRTRGLRRPMTRSAVRSWHCGS